MSGALTEGAFVQGLTRAGFAQVAVVERVQYGVAELEAEPLFPEDLVALMRRLLPRDIQESIGSRIVITAVNPPQ